MPDFLQAYLQDQAMHETMEQHASVFPPMLRSARGWERHSYGPCLEGNNESKQTWENWSVGALRVASIYILLKCMLVNYHGESERGIKHSHVAQWLHTAPGGRGAVPLQQAMAINSSCGADSTIGHHQQLTGYWGIHFILGITTWPCYPNQVKKQ